MRNRVLSIIFVLAAVAGCQAGPSTAAGPTTTRTTSKRLAPTTTPPPRTTPKPDANTPHQVVTFRLFAADADHTPALFPETSNPNPVYDERSAKQIRQDPALTTDKAAQQRAMASLDCHAADPLAGKVDANLPVALCLADGSEAVLAPTLLDAGKIAGASYGPSTLANGGWTVSVELTAAGRQIVTEMAPKNVNVLLELLFDEQPQVGLSVDEKLAGTLEFDFGTKENATLVAAIINNR